MFGKNPVAKEDYRSDGALWVRETFYTIQGEGPDAGTPAVFVRLAGCNLRCYFCDTDFDLEKSELVSVQALVDRVASLSPGGLIVITGGEPLRQNIVPFVRHLHPFPQWRVQIETAGTLYPKDLGDYFYPGNPKKNSIVCSPKTPKLSPAIESLVSAYKYIVAAGHVSDEDGLPVLCTQVKGRHVPVARPITLAPVFVQAMDEGHATRNRANLDLAAGIAMRFGYRLSVQTHKILGLP